MNNWVALTRRDEAHSMLRYKRTTIDSNYQPHVPILAAVVDSGCDIAHPDLRRVIASSHYHEGDGMMNKEESHGTGSCGLLAGEPGGDAKFPGGMAHGFARLHAVRYKSVVDIGIDQDMYKKIGAKKPKVVSNSFGSRNLEPQEVTKIRNAYLTLEQLGITVVIAAGNGSGVIASQSAKKGKLIPVTPDTIVVAASCWNEKENKESKVGTSNHGGCITVCAPSGGAEGGCAVSTANRGEGLLAIHTSLDYDYHTDTSGACPLVAGVVVLMLQANPGLTPRQIKTILCETADQIDPQRNGTGAWREASGGNVDVNLYQNLSTPLKNKLYSQAYGFGRINAEEAVRAAFLAAGCQIVGNVHHGY